MKKKADLEEELSLDDYLRVIIKRKKIILVVSSIFVLIAIIVVFSTPKRYRVKAIIQNGAFGYFIEERGLMRREIISAEEAEVIIKSSNFLKPVLKKIGLENIPRKSIKINPIKNTNFFDLEIYLKDKEKIYDLANEIINSYIDYARGESGKYSNIFPYLTPIEEFKIIEPPTAAECISISGGKRGIAISAVLGLMIGIIVAFFQESIANSNK